MENLAQSARQSARDLLERSMEWMDRFWDEKAWLLWDMGETVEPGSDAHTNHHVVRETAWYALGLLMRDGPDDAERAAQAIETLFVNQLHEPGAVYHGTFYRAPEEPHPPAAPVEWKDYDPNWREFVITTVSLILSEYESRLPARLVDLLDIAIRTAVEGALARPLVARYTNIALMHAPMLVFAGDRLGEPAWIEAGQGMAREVHSLFRQHDAFEEYNSPTYYGPDIYALRLWQRCPSGTLHEMGAEMEAMLWRDVARFYHAGLRNVAGPYDRAYGMDMRRYVAILGEWIWLAAGQDHAPFPDLHAPFAHAADFCFAPLVAAAGARVPEDALPHFLSFRGERSVEQIVSDSPRRVATAWLGADVMIGAEHTARSKAGQPQFHPATIHWQAGTGPGGDPGEGRVGWARLRHTLPVDAVALPGRLEIAGSDELAFEIDAPGIEPGMIEPERWTLPGLRARIQANAPCTVTRAGERALVGYAAGPGAEIRIELELE